MGIDLTVWFTGFGLTVWFTGFDLTVWSVELDLTVWFDKYRRRGVASVLSAVLSAACQSCTTFLTNTIRCWTTLQFKLASTSSRILPFCAERRQVVAACSVVVDSSSMAGGLTVDCITMFLW